jgi:hypothetical protein
LLGLPRASDAGEREREGGSGCCNVGLEREGAREGAREGRVRCEKDFTLSRFAHTSLFAHLCTLSTPSSSLPTCHAPPCVQCSSCTATRTQTCIQHISRCLSKLLGLISSPLLLLHRMLIPRRRTTTPTAHSHSPLPSPPRFLHSPPRSRSTPSGSNLTICGKPRGRPCSGALL